MSGPLPVDPRGLVAEASLRSHRSVPQLLPELHSLFCTCDPFSLTFDSLACTFTCTFPFNSSPALDDQWGSDANGVHAIGEQLASRCGYTISSFTAEGFTTFKASYYSCFTLHQVSTPPLLAVSGAPPHHCCIDATSRPSE